MNRFEWIVPVIVFAVYVLGHILKAKEAVQQAQQPAKRNPGQELDRFLQEIERLRQQQENRATGPKQQPEYDDFDEMPTPQKPVVVVREVRPPPLLPRPVVLQVQPAPQPKPREPEPVERKLPVAPQPKVSAVSTTRRPRANAAGTAIQLLSNRKNIAAAFALNEILGPPKCKR